MIDQEIQNAGIIQDDTVTDSTSVSQHQQCATTRRTAFELMVEKSASPHKHWSNDGLELAEAEWDYYTKGDIGTAPSGPVHADVSEFGKIKVSYGN